MPETECHCGGANENCSSCFGSGYVDRHKVSLIARESLSIQRPSKSQPTKSFSLNKGKAPLPEPANFARASKPKAKAASSRKLRCVLCTTLKKRMKAQVLRDHLVKVHKIYGREQQPYILLGADSSTKAKPTPYNQPEPSTFEVDAVSDRDTRDATRLYAHAFRGDGEDGRYGSHAIHDDYDDESTAD